MPPSATPRSSASHSIGEEEGLASQLLPLRLRTSWMRALPHLSHLFPSQGTWAQACHCLHPGSHKMENESVITAISSRCNSLSLKQPFKHQSDGSVSLPREPSHSFHVAWKLASFQQQPPELPLEAPVSLLPPTIGWRLSRSQPLCFS